MRPLPLLVLVAALVAGVGAAEGARDAVNRPLLGVSGQADRFRAQTGQDSQVRQLFLGWGQGSSWGTPLADLLPTLKPVPLLHLGTDAGRPGREAITPAQIATGRGDPYLIALNRAIAGYGGELYVRVLAEMNNPRNHYAPTRPNGTSKGPSHSPTAYKQAFRRISLILHGGTTVDAALGRLGMPPVGRELAENRVPALTVVWNPLAGLDPGSARPAQEFYPGDVFVDMVGNDMFATRTGVASHAANEALYRAHPDKPYALAEWGVTVDDPGFVKRVCRFLKTSPRVRLAAYYDARPGSPFDLGAKRAARAEYRRCITPIGASAASRNPPGPPTSAQLALTAEPGRGEAPLEVRFATRVSLAKPVVRWELTVGDGKVLGGSGPPPASISHTYAEKGIYDAALVVFLAPPFAGSGIRYVTQARVQVGKGGSEPLRLDPSPLSGKAPFPVSFRTTVRHARAATRWDFVAGDGSARSGPGKPPRILGHTYTIPGVYRAVLVLHLGRGERLLTYVDVRVR
ncbi:MAG: hypothetical protein HOQ03_11580 [Thermoleophilia bacterium]|nr:hypothetical protein [Thermoleophilia bacterium]